ncbi:MAG: TonB-dependent receptor [Candidatus Sabulitectum sp.]|nr:TonB-dependent receptor [Candidatus Sabulitectum sp.]
MLYLILVSSGFFVQQIDGSPIPGAWVGSDGAWFGFTDHLGYYSFQGSEPDSFCVHATGFSDWSGAIPLDGTTIHLQETVFDTGESILVTASRGSLESAIPSTTRLTDRELSELSASGMGYLNGRVPGVSVREYGGSMPIVSVSIRGGDPSQVDYMVDGISIVSARDGMPTGIFDPAVFTSVEIARGGAIAGGSGSGSAGAVNYLPPLLSQPLSISFSALSNGGVYFNGKHSGSAISLRRNIGNTGTEGYSTTLLTTRRYRNLGIGFLGAWASGDTEGPTWSIESDGHRKQGQAEGWATLVHKSLEMDISVGTSIMDYRQTQPFDVDDTHSDFSVRTSLQWNGPLTVRGGFNRTWLNSSATDDHAMQFGTIHVTKQYNLLFANMGLRVASDGNTHLSGRVTVEKHRESFHLFTSAFSDFRAPTVNDLYWPSDGYTSGNPELESERTTGAEIGAGWNGISSSGDICGFITRSNDLIMWLPDDSGVWSPSNISSSFSKGVELSSSFDMGFATFSGTFTWNIATDETTDTPREGMLLPYRPEYTWGGGSYIELPLGLAVELNVNGMGKRFTNRTQSEYLSEYWIAHAALKRELSHSVSMELGVGNIFNTVYEETNGYAGRGRTLRMTLEYTGE